MRTITIERRSNGISQPMEVAVLFDCKAAGVIKAEEKSVCLPITKGEHSIQVEMEVNGNKYRSNAYFAMGGKDIHLYLDISGTRLNLLTK